MSEKGSLGPRIGTFVGGAIYYGILAAGAIYLFFQFDSLSMAERGTWVVFGLIVYTNYALGKKLDEIDMIVREIRHYLHNQ